MFLSEDPARSREAWDTLNSHTQSHSPHSPCSQGAGRLQLHENPSVPHRPVMLLPHRAARRLLPAEMWNPGTAPSCLIWLCPSEHVILQDAEGLCLLLLLYELPEVLLAQNLFTFQYFITKRRLEHWNQCLSLKDFLYWHSHLLFPA